MSARYITAPRRYSTAIDGSVESTADNADFFSVVDVSTGTRVCRCDTADMAAAVLTGLAAVDDLAALTARVERCRLAAGFVLDAVPETIEAAVAGLLVRFESVAIQLLSTEQTGAGQ